MFTQLHKLAALLPTRQENPEAHVHFHAGAQGHPAACHDPACPAPRLKV